MSMFITAGLNTSLFPILSFIAFETFYSYANDDGITSSRFGSMNLGVLLNFGISLLELGR